MSYHDLALQSPQGVSSQGRIIAPHYVGPPVRPQNLSDRRDYRDQEGNASFSPALEPQLHFYRERLLRVQAAITKGHCA